MDTFKVSLHEYTRCNDDINPNDNTLCNLLPFIFYENV